MPNVKIRLGSCQPTQYSSKCERYKTFPNRSERRFKRFQNPTGYHAERGNQQHMRIF